MKASTFLIFAIGTFGLTASTSAIGGSRFDFECVKNGNHYRDSISFGGGFTFSEISGYCPSTHKMVSRTWKTSYHIGEQPPEPPTSIPIFDPSSGNTLHAYAIDGCPVPVVPIENEEQLRRIPECNGGEFTKSNEIEYD